MKGYSMWIIALMVLPVTSTEHKSVAVTFGPKGCVSLTRSHEGSCVLSTECEGNDISATEFAFDCVAQSGNGDIVRHSFGVGGFEVNEEFDTEVKCGRCSHPAEAGAPTKHKKKKVEVIMKQPAPVAVAPPAPKAAPVEVATPKHAEKKEKIPGVVAFRAKGQAAANAKAKMWPFTSSKTPAVPAVMQEGPAKVKYGPKGCVSTWRSSEGHCMMATDCEGVNIKDYEFGLVCVDKVGSPVKHLFGKDSFDSKESFDTLIKCRECLGLEDVPDQVVIAGEVATMAKELTNLKDVMKNISVNVQMLNAKVFPAAPAAAPSPAAASPAPAAAPKQEKALVHQATSHHRHRGNLRRAHRHHHHHRRRDDDDDEDEDEDEDRDDRRDDDDDDRQNVREALARVADVAVQAPVAVVEAPKAPVAAVEVVSKVAASDDEDDEEGDGED